MQDSTNKKLTANITDTQADNSYNQIKAAVESKLRRYYGITPSEATEEQFYRSIVLTVKDKCLCSNGR